MIDYPTLTQQAAFAARIVSLSEAVAKRLVALPKDQREAGLTKVRRIYAAERSPASREGPSETKTPVGGADPICWIVGVVSQIVSQVVCCSSPHNGNEQLAIVLLGWGRGGSAGQCASAALSPR
jgi:hypothetical protein